MTAIPASDALLTDGRIVRIRPGVGGDHAGVRGLHERLSPGSVYLRYFSVSVPPERYFDQLLRPADGTHQTLVVELGGQVVAVAGYERLADDRVAEVSFLVDDEHQGLDIASLLLEHLAAGAAESGVQRFVAETLPHNVAMLTVFRAAGFQVQTRHQDGEIRVEFPVHPDEGALSAADAREALAEFRSMHNLLAPTSVTVVGAGHDPEGLGHLVLANILAGGYSGAVFPVNSDGAEAPGRPNWHSVSEVPDPVDLVVVAVPPQAVPDVARQAAARGARSLVVVTADFAESGPAGAARQRELLEICRVGGMRLVGPNCMGILSNVGGVALNATFSASRPPSGQVGLMSQSGAVGLAALAYAARTGVGIASFISAGNKADVSGNDLLCFWERDSDTRVCAFYLESFGNPRKFARLARRVGRTKPVVAVKSGRSVAGGRGVASQTAAAATPEVAVDALFAQAGVIRADSLAELFDVVTLLERAPLPAGRKVAIVGNSGGPGVLAADACETAGLVVPELSSQVRERLLPLLPAGAAVSNPVALFTGARPETMHGALVAVLSDPGVDSVIAVITPVRPGTEEAMAKAVAAAAAGADKPVLAVFLGASEAPAALRGDNGALVLPFHPFPEPAARALAAVTRYALWQRQPTGTPATLAGIDRDAARKIVQAAFEAFPAGCWLPLDTAAALVSCYGVNVNPTVSVSDATQAAAVAGRFTGPVALKAAGGALVHKTDLGAVRLNLATPDEVSAAFAEMADRLGPDMGGGVIQPMAEPGVDTAAGVVSDPAFGPLVMFGLGGVASDLLADRSFRILPLSQEDAAAQVRGLRASPLLSGYRGSRPVDLAALEDVLLRIARLAQDVPELAELDINPLVATAGGVLAVDVKVRLAPGPAQFPLLRRLRSA